VAEGAFGRDETRVLFEVLFDIRALVARLVAVVEGGEDDEEEEDGEDEDPDLR
jgi:hypothetical protein